MDALDDAHDAVSVVLLHLHVGLQFKEHVVQLRRGQLFQLRTVGEIRLLVREQIPIEHRIDVQARAAHNHRQTSPAADLVDRPIGHALEIRHGEKFVGLAHVDQVVRHALRLLGRDLAAAQIKAAEHLARIRRDDLRIILLRQLDAQRALAGRVCAHDGDNLR